MASPPGLLTAEEFARLPSSDEHIDWVDELARGLVERRMPNSALKGYVAANLICSLGDSLEPSQQVRVLSRCGFILSRDPDTVRAPDGSIVVGRRKDEYWPDTPPRLAALVVDPWDIPTLADRILDFLQAGSRRVWVVWPQRRAVTTHRPDGTSITRESDAVLTTDDLGFEVPDFQLPIADIFPPRT